MIISNDLPIKHVKVKHAFLVKGMVNSFRNPWQPIPMSWVFLIESVGSEACEVSYELELCLKAAD